MNTYTIDNRNKTIILEFDFDKDLIAAIKRCSFNAHWNPELKFWIIPIDDWSKPNVIRLINDWGFKDKPKKVEEQVKYDYSVDPILMEKLKTVCQNKNFYLQPRDYQLESLYYGLKKGNHINGDDVGIGKSFEAIIYAEVNNSFPCLVVVPASIKYAWAEKWIEIVGKQRTISVIESKGKNNNWNAEVVVINYDILGKKAGKGSTVKFPELLSTKWKMFIFDEGHFLKEASSQRSKAARMITKKSKGIIQLLTGTATMSKPSELWNLLVMIKKDDLISDSWKQFSMRYCGGYQSKFGWVSNGATSTLELNKKLRDTCYLRREKRDVLKELPDIEKVIIKMPITNKKEIGRAMDNLIEYIRETKGDEKAEKAMEAESLVALGVLRKLSIEGKLKAIEQYLRDWKVSGIKLLIFGLHKEPLIELSEKFKSKLIAGGITSKKKQEIVKEWIANDEVFLFANMESAGTGVDGLQQVCSNMLIIELPWRPSDLTQVIARVDRSGQKDPSTVRFMLSEDTIDMDMWSMLEEKEIVTEAVNKGVDVIENKSGMKIVMNKISKRINKK
jgi:SWI/SNF-related matrix-associated actin-dependent regulator 1 of chromatin subfamily A